MLGASSCTYAEATWTQTLPDWIGAHVRMFRFYGAAPRLLVPDNLKSGINKVSFYDPEVNRSYAAMAGALQRRRSPASPAKAPARQGCTVEAGEVRCAQSYIIGRLRNVTFFFSLAECNVAIAAAVERMNAREMRRLGTSRRQLSSRRSSYPSCSGFRRTISNMPSGISPASALTITVEVKGFLYSVPHALLREQVDTRATASFDGDLPSRQTHCRPCPAPWRPAPRHRARAHAERPPPLCAEWTPERMQRQARGIGPNTEALITWRRSMSCDRSVRSRRCSTTPKRPSRVTSSNTSGAGVRIPTKPPGYTGEAYPRTVPN